MVVKKEEFLALKQGPMSVRSIEIGFCNYPAMLLKMSTLMPRGSTVRGLVDPLHYQLMNHTFLTF
jgi:hypothetical protein